MQTAPSPGEQTERVQLLPPFGRLLKTACLVVCSAGAVLLIFGYAHLAFSMAAGFAVSILVCGVLYLLVGRCMAYYVASVGGKGGSAVNSGAMVQMAALLVGKFLVLGLAAYAVISIHGISLLAVLAGFLMTHTAVIVSATTQMTKR